MFTEDLTPFFNNAEHAVDAVYDGSTTIQVLFDDSDQGALGVGGSNPTAMCPATSVAADPTDKTLVIAGTTYKIRDIRPQDDGAIVLLQLERQ